MIPNRADVAYAGQSRLFSQDLAIMTAVALGERTLTGCGVTAQGSPNMTVIVAAGTVQRALIEIVVAGDAAKAITAAHATGDRIDVVSLDDAGAVIYTAGTPVVVGPTTFPSPPALPTSGGRINTVAAFVYVPAAVVAITSAMITDKRT